MSTAFLTVATGDYLRYAERNAQSLSQRNEDARIVCITDVRERVSWTFSAELPWPHLGWPFATLLRYEAYLTDPLAWTFSDTTHVYAMDADLLWQRDPWPDLKDHDLVFAAHPGYGGVHQKPPPPGTWDGLMDPLVFKPPPYLAGGFWGGKRDNFLGVCEEIRDQIRRLAREGIVPVWHDETVVQRVALWNPHHTLPWGWLAPDAACPWYQGDRAQACVLAVTKPQGAR